MVFFKPFLIGLVLSLLFWYLFIEYGRSLGFAALLLLPLAFLPFAPVVIGFVIGLMRLFKRK